MKHISLELVRLMNDAIAHKQKAVKKTLTSRDIANHLRISDQRFSTYATGSRIPHQAFAETLARYFFTTAQERTEFLVALNTIRAGTYEIARRTAGTSLVERLARGQALRVSTFEMEPFAGRHDDFFDQVFDRFFRLSGLTTAHIPQRRLTITDLLWESTADLYISCIASVDSSLLANFWTTPIRLSLGAIIHSKHKREKEKVKRILTLQERKPHLLQPVVIKGEPGYTYCRERLNSDETGLVCLESRDPAALASTLRQLSTTSTQIPVVVVDEYTSFAVLGELGNEGLPVISLSTWGNNETDIARRELPHYFLGFACARSKEELRAMIDQAFSLFLSTETNTIADALAALYENLIHKLLPPGRTAKSVMDYYFERPAESHDSEIGALRYRLARRWALYALTLDRTSLESYPAVGPWKAILQRAREIVQESVALEREEIRHQLALCSGYPDHPRPLSYSEFRELCAVFDLREPELNYAQQQYILEDRDMVVATIQSALRGKSVPSLEPPTLHVEVMSSPFTQEVAGVVSGFLWAISRMYSRELGASNSSTRQLAELLQSSGIDPIEQYERLSRQFTSVVLAWHGNQGRHYIGCACIRPFRDVSGEMVEGALELCYLYVLEPFRGLKIARHLLYEAHQAAKVQGYTTLVYWILPQYFEGIRYLGKRGFSWRKDRLGREGRIVLEYNTGDPFPYPKA